MRKDPLVNGEVYHIFSRSIANYKIFNDKFDFLRFVQTINYYQNENPPDRFSRFLRLSKKQQDFFMIKNKHKKIVQVIAFCIMPTHPHLILKQLKKNGISIFMKKTLDSYTRYFNTKYHRKGPLWESRFQSVLVENDEQLLHLTRYIHLNAVTADLINKPEKWLWSSYNEYLLKVKKDETICDYDKILEIKPKVYQKFVEERIDYQKELAKIKSLLIENI